MMNNPIRAPKAPWHRKLRAFFWSSHTKGYQGPRGFRFGILGRMTSRTMRQEMMAWRKYTTISHLQAVRMMRYNHAFWKHG